MSDRMKQSVGGESSKPGPKIPIDLIPGADEVLAQTRAQADILKSITSWLRKENREAEITWDYKLPIVPVQPSYRTKEKIRSSTFEKMMTDYSIQFYNAREREKKGSGFYPPITVSYARSGKNSIAEATNHFCTHMGVAFYKPGVGIRVYEAVGPVREVDLNTFRKKYPYLSVKHLTDARIQAIDDVARVDGISPQAVVDRMHAEARRIMNRPYDHPFTTEDFEKKYDLALADYCSELWHKLHVATGAFPDIDALQMAKYKLDYSSDLTYGRLKNILAAYGFPIKTPAIDRAFKAALEEKLPPAFIIDTAITSGALKGDMVNKLKARRQILVDYFKDPIIPPGAVYDWDGLNEFHGTNYKK